MELEIAYITAFAALLGTLAGGLVSYFTTRHTIERQHRHERISAEISRREDLYSEFVSESARLLVMSATSRTEDMSEFTKLYSLASRIKIIGSDKVADAASELSSITLKACIKASENKEDISENNQTAGTLRNVFTGAAKADLKNKGA
jgi:hypothetical protein